MPYNNVLDVLSNASKSTTEFMNRKLQAAPVFVKQIIKSEDNGNGANDILPVNNSEPDLYKNISITNIIKVYEIWQLFLDYNPNDNFEIYIVISGDFLQKGYQNGEWSNFEYEGFYSTIQEAENNIMSYMK